MRLLFAVNLEEPVQVCQQVQGLAQKLSADLYILHACPPRPPAFTAADPISGLGAFASYALYDPDLQENIQKAEASAFDSFLTRSFSMPVIPSLRNGYPSEAILADAEEHHIDIIVIGKRHHSALEKFLVGDVASSVIKNANRQVLLVPIE